MLKFILSLSQFFPVTFVVASYTYIGRNVLIRFFFQASGYFINIIYFWKYDHKFMGRVLYVRGLINKRRGISGSDPQQLQPRCLVFSTNKVNICFGWIGYFTRVRGKSFEYIPRNVEAYNSRFLVLLNIYI